MATEILADDFKIEPYWWEDAPRPEVDKEDLPDEVDVLVVGSGLYRSARGSTNGARRDGDAGVGRTTTGGRL